MLGRVVYKPVKVVMLDLTDGPCAPASGFHQMLPSNATSSVHWLSPAECSAASAHQSHSSMGQETENRAARLFLFYSYLIFGLS